MTRGKFVAAAALAAIVIALAACSSQGSGTTTNAAGTAPPGQATGVQTSDTPVTFAADQPGVEHLKYKYGPIHIEPGQNSIDLSAGDIAKPDVDGFIVGIRPDLVRASDGSIPRVDVIHLHHGVWLNLDHKDSTTPQLPERFFAAGEEKTIMRLPPGYGYPYKASEKWLINYMLHNLLTAPDDVFITYDIDFIPQTAPEAAGIKPARPIWMDVENGKTYPVFDALKGSGKDGTFVYPDDVPDTYTNRPQPRQRRRNDGGATPSTAAPAPPILNEWKVNTDGVLLGTAGHLHPGGLHTDMYLTRDGASAAAGSDAASEVQGDKAHLFTSEAVYYEPAGAVSWDVSMTATPADWRVRVKAGDTISINATYDVRNASWYESMGIMVLWMADGDDATAGHGDDPFQTRVAKKGSVTHGHLPENDNHGGGTDASYANMLQLPSTSAADGTVQIADFVYSPGDMQNGQSVPQVAPGQTLTFKNNDDKATPKGLWHTITACKAPCDKSTGIAYPLADGDVQFDSGELGTGGQPTSDKLEWSIPTNLSPGTYTYFCRIHPFMRGAFRVGDQTAGAGTTGG